MRRHHVTFFHRNVGEERLAKLLAHEVHTTRSRRSIRWTGRWRGTWSSAPIPPRPQIPSTGAVLETSVVGLRKRQILSENDARQHRRPRRPERRRQDDDAQD